MLLLASAVVLLLVVLNGVFAMSELAVVSSRRTRLQSRAERGDKGAAAALKLSENPTRFLSAVQVGITLIGILAGAYGQATIAGELDHILERYPLIAPYSEALATGIVVVVLTYLSLVVGELAPKRVALIFPETIASVVARPLSLMALAMGPFVTLLTGSTAFVLKLFGVHDDKGEDITQEEVETMLAEGASAGLIEPEEQAMMTEVMRLGDRAVRVAMTPRRDLYWIALSDPESKILSEIRACPHSRIVVARERDLDGPLGVIHKKDLLDALLDNPAPNLEPLVTTPLYIPETTTVLKALQLFKTTPLHIGFVVDEFGVLEGIVTPTDLLEMIAGDFPESHDEATPSAVLRRADGSFLVDGRADMDTLTADLGEDFGAMHGYHTVAGLVLDRLSRIPAEGEVFDIGSYRVEVIDMDERRIDKLLFTKRPEEKPQGDLSGG